MGGDLALPEAEPFPVGLPQPLTGAGPIKSSSTDHQDESLLEFGEAPMGRKRRALRELPRDNTTELRNSDLAYWNNNYLANMAAEDQAKLLRKSSRLAKKNARYWVYGSGVGGVGSSSGKLVVNNPLSMFTGNSLMEALTGITSPVSGRKRARQAEPGQESDIEGRRVRSRDGGVELSNGDILPPLEDEPTANLAGEVMSRCFAFLHGAKPLTGY